MSNNKQTIVNNGILISTTKTGIEFCTTIKESVKDFSGQIDYNIKLINLLKFYTSLIEDDEINIPNELPLEMRKYIKIIDIHCILLEFTINISLSLQGLYFAENKSEQIFYAKSMYIEIYRFLERYNKELGSIKYAAEKAELKKQFIEMRRLDETFRENHYKRIKEYRNKFYAHFDNSNSYWDYNQTIVDINGEKEANIGLDFLKVIKYISSLFTLIVKYITTKMPKEMNLSLEN